MSTLIFLCVLGILLWVSNINNRLNALEAQQGKSAPLSIQTPKEVSIPAAHVMQESIIPSPVSTQVHSPATSNTFEHWLKTDWQMKLGALLLLISFGWLARYAVLHDWIGPTGRIAFGILSGIAIAAFGSYRMIKERLQGEVFIVLGASIVLVTIFAARSYYDMFTPLSALFLMFVTSSCTAITSIKNKSAALALSGIIMAGIAPLLSVATEANTFMLFTYLLAITLGSLWLAFVHERREIIAGGLGIYAFYSVMQASTVLSERPDFIMLGLFFVFAGIFAAANVSGFIKSTQKEHASDIIVALINNLLLVMWIYQIAPEAYQATLYLLWAAIFAGAAFACRIFSRTKELWSMYLGSAILMLALATNRLFDGNTLIIAYTLESLAIIGTIHLIRKDFAITRRLTWLLILPTLLSSELVFSSHWTSTTIWPTVGTLALITAAYSLLALFFKQISDESKSAHNTVTTLVIIASAYFYVIIWHMTHVWLSVDIAVMSSLIVYTLIGLATNLYGQLHSHKRLRYYGGALLGLAVLRLLMIDIWEMSIPGRIATFFLIGTLLMSTAFIGRSKSRTIAQ